MKKKNDKENEEILSGAINNKLILAYILSPF